MKDRINMKWLQSKLTPVIVEALLTCVCLNQIWYTNLPKFHDLTVELGTETVSLSDFATEHAGRGKLHFVSDPGEVNLNRVGTTEVTLGRGLEQETVTLTVVDTTAPEVSFVDEVLCRIDSVPTVEDFIADISDESETKAYLDSAVVVPKDYSDLTVRVVVEDAHGNVTKKDCLVKYQWMETSYTLEYGDTLTLEGILLDPVRDAVLVNQESIAQINGGNVGTYEVTGQIGNQTAACQVTVTDTTGPVLEVKNFRTNRGGTATVDSFVASVADISGVKEVRLMSQVNTAEFGQYPMTIEAEDIYGNITTKEAVLFVAVENIPPVISGARDDLTLQKHSTPDLLEGVSAMDYHDGACEVVCDAGNLDTSVAGTYYINYTAMDKSGNVATVRRKVIVEHDQEDTAALVASIAETLGNDPEKLRDYVRSYIGYNTSWGGDDPVWHGFTTRGGNCYVHAMCLQEIFDLKGIESQLIWVTNKSHYWLLVKIDGAWKHIDPTPSPLHGRYSLMNDAQRLSTLSGRRWDTTQWPACE